MRSYFDRDDSFSFDFIHIKEQGDFPVAIQTEVSTRKPLERSSSS